MTGSLANAILLMLIGMITVFVILSIVVLTGRGLIAIVNRYHKEPENASEIPKEHIAVITAVANELSQGHAHSVKIDRL